MIPYPVAIKSVGNPDLGLIVIEFFQGDALEPGIEDLFRHLFSQPTDACFPNGGYVHNKPLLFMNSTSRSTPVDNVPVSADTSSLRFGWRPLPSHRKLNLSPAHDPTIPTLLRHISTPFG